MYDSETNSSDAANDDTDKPPIARSTKHRGWAGEDMEMQHQRECLKRQKHSSSGAAAFTAVDLNQFRNTEVGRGYQAKGVVRQRSSVHADNVDGGNFSVIKDLTQKSGDTRSSVAEGKRDVHKSRQSQSRKRKLEGEQNKCSKLSLTHAYLHSQGIRDFRKELDNILNEAKS